MSNSELLEYQQRKIKDQDQGNRRNHRRSEKRKRNGKGY